MIVFKNLTLRNFLSVGAITQAVSLDTSELTLVLGENLDLGGGAARNGVGKCVGINTTVKVRNTVTGEIFETTIGELYANGKENQTRND